MKSMKTAAVIASVALLAAVTATGADAAIVVENSMASAQLDGTVVSSGSITFDMSGGDFLAVAITAGGTLGDLDATLDYASNTGFVQSVDGDDKDNWSAIYYLTDPASGSNTLQVTLTTDDAGGDPLNNTASDFQFAAYSLSNVDPVTPVAHAEETLGNKMTSWTLLSSSPGIISNGDVLVMANIARNSLATPAPDWHVPNDTQTLVYRNATAGNDGKSDYRVRVCRPDRRRSDRRGRPEHRGR